MTKAIHCPNCGREQSGDSNTCHACGTSFDSEAEYKQEMVENSNRYITVVLAVIAVLIFIALFLR